MLKDNKEMELSNNKEREVRFAKVGLKLGLVTKEQVRECLALSKAINQPFKDTLLKKRYLDKSGVSQIEELLSNIENQLQKLRKTHESPLVSTQNISSEKPPSDKEEPGIYMEETLQEIKSVDASYENISDSQGERVPKLSGYKILKVLGKGAMGTVYLAEHILMHRLVAIKVLTPQLQKDHQFLERFFREIRCVAKLHHENIVSGLDVNTQDGLYFLVMEYVEGKNIGEILETKGRFSEREAVDIIIEVTKALCHAYKNGLIHRDIKPENIIISKEGNVKICDLGLAKEVGKEGTALTQEGTFVGTPQYISPEQAMGETKLDTRSDIYSLGITLFQMLTGRAPFINSNPAVVCTMHITNPLPDPRKWQPSLSKETRALVFKMTSKKPEDRIQNPEMLLQILLEIQKILKQKEKVNTPARQKKPQESKNNEVLSIIEGDKNPFPENPAHIQPTTTIEDIKIPVQTQFERSKKPVYIFLGAVVLLSIFGVIMLTGKKRTGIHEEKKTALDIFKDIEEETKRIPVQYERLIDRLKDLSSSYPNTQIADESDKRIKKLEERAQKEARLIYEQIEKEAKHKEEKGKPEEAIKAYDSFPDNLSFTYYSKNIIEQKEKLKVRVHQKFMDMMNEGNQLVKSNDYRQAFQVYQKALDNALDNDDIGRAKKEIVLLEGKLSVHRNFLDLMDEAEILVNANEYKRAIEVYNKAKKKAFPEEVSRVEAKIAKLTETMKQKESAKDIIDDVQKYYEGYISRFRDNMKERKYDLAMESFEKVKKSFETLGGNYTQNHIYKDITHYQDDIKVIEKFLKQVNEGVQKIIGEEIFVYTSGISVKSKILEANDDKIKFLSKEGESEHSLYSLSSETLENLSSKLTKDGEFYFALGLICYYDDIPEKGKRYLQTALENGIKEKRIEPYLFEINIKISAIQARKRRNILQEEKENLNNLRREADQLGLRLSSEFRTSNVNFQKVIDILNSLKGLIAQEYMMGDYIEVNVIKEPIEDYVKNLYKKCPNCRGGIDGQNHMNCGKCFGRGKITVSGKNKNYEVSCPTCRGLGKILCPVCAGIFQKSSYRSLVSVINSVMKICNEKKLKRESLLETMRPVAITVQQKLQGRSASDAIDEIKRFYDLYPDRDVSRLIETEDILNIAFPNGVEKDLLNIPCSKCNNKRYIKDESGELVPCPECYRLITSESFLEMAEFFCVPCQVPSRQD